MTALEDAKLKLPVLAPDQANYTSVKVDGPDAREEVSRLHLPARRSLSLLRLKHFKKVSRWTVLSAWSP